MQKSRGFGFSERHSIDHIRALGRAGLLRKIRDRLLCADTPNPALKVLFAEAVKFLDVGDMEGLDKALMDAAHLSNQMHTADPARAIGLIVDLADIANCFLCQRLAAERYLDACTFSADPSLDLPVGLVRNTLWFLGYNSRGGRDSSSPEPRQRATLMYEQVILPRLAVLGRRHSAQGLPQSNAMEIVNAWIELSARLSLFSVGQALIVVQLLECEALAAKGTAADGTYAEIQHSLAKILDKIFDETKELPYLERAYSALMAWFHAPRKEGSSPLHEWEDEITPMAEKLFPLRKNDIS